MWSSELADLIREAIHKRKTVLWENIDRNSIVDKFKKLLSICTDNLHQKIIALIKSLTKYKEFVFKFLIRNKIRTQHIGYWFFIQFIFYPNCIDYWFKMSRLLVLIVVPLTVLILSLFKPLSEASGRG